MKRLHYHIATGGLLLLGLALLQPAAGQGIPDSLRSPAPGDSISVPIPERGVIYLRFGKPGGVHVRPRRRTLPSQPLGRDSETLTAAPGTPLTPADLARLEDRLLQRLDRLERLLRDWETGERLRLVESPSGPVVVLLPGQPGTPADTLYPAPLDAALADSLSANRRAAEPPPTAADVERAFLQTGYFRALNVNFAFDESRLLPSARPTLDAVSEVLARYPTLRLEIAGHTDATGPASYNQRLSEARATSVRTYLIQEANIAPNRLQTVGYGEAVPIADNDTPTGRALNRRVEFTLLNPEVLETQLQQRAQQEAAQQLHDSLETAIQEELQRLDLAPDTTKQ